MRSEWRSCFDCGRPTRELRRLHLFVVALVSALIGCHRDMRDQPRYETLEASPLFANGQATRPVPKGTVARGRLTEDAPLETARSADGQFVHQIPVELDR